MDFDPGAVRAWLLGEPEPDDFDLIVAALERAGWPGEAGRLESLAESMAECERGLAAIGTSPQGRHPDGTPVTDAEKQAARDMYERVQAEHERRGGRGWRQAAYALLLPDDGRPMLGRLFGAD